MAPEGISPALAIRSSVGVELWSTTGPKVPYAQNESFTPDQSKCCRALEFSSCGQFLAWANGTNVRVCKVSDWSVVCTLPRPKAFYLKFSPKGTYLMTWQVFTTTKDNLEGDPNLHIFKVENGEEMYSVRKKQTDWVPDWSLDESMFALMVGGEAFFYEVNSDSGFTKPFTKLGGGRNGQVSVSPGLTTVHVAFYVPGTKNLPSMCKLYPYKSMEATRALACKSFYQADKINLMWNQRGTGLLILTSTDVDQTGSSYYGKMALHFMTTKCDSHTVCLDKEGPIHAVQWSPKSTEFCVIYGFMPAKATLFNMKCDAVRELGVGPWNSIYYNGFGNILLLAGFGNLRGNIDVWDAVKKEKVTSLQAPDSTLLEWSSVGDVFVTATTAPRLRQSNGFKVWHYSGALLHETMWPKDQELLSVSWQKYASGTFEAKPISKAKVEGIQSAQPQASAAIYRPPIARGTANNSATTPEEENKPQQYLPPGMTRKKPENKSKRVKDGANRGKKLNDKPIQRSQHTGEQISDLIQSEEMMQAQLAAANKLLQAPGTPKNHTVLSEKDRRIKSINKKLREIALLKVKAEAGERLNSRQVIKYQKETELISELNALKLAAN